jgi:hypothetical protein
MFFFWQKPIIFNGKFLLDSVLTVLVVPIYLLPISVRTDIYKEILYKNPQDPNQWAPIPNSNVIFMN